MCVTGISGDKNTLIDRVLGCNTLANYTIRLGGYGPPNGPPPTDVYRPPFDAILGGNLVRMERFVRHLEQSLRTHLTLVNPPTGVYNACVGQLNV